MWLALMNNFEENVIKVWGADGAVWLKQLPELLDYFIQEWQLSNVMPMENLSFHYVAYTWSQLYQGDVVLKISMLDSGYFHEINALSYFNGLGCVKLIAHDNQKGGMLLEALRPGTTVKSLFPYEEIKAMQIAATVIQKLHHSNKPYAVKDYETIEQWLRALYTIENSDIPVQRLQKAQTLAKELLATPQELYVLHGDLHHDNILFDEQRSWIAIDPKGVIGPLEYEVGAFIRGPMPELLAQENASQIITTRIDQCVQMLNLDKQRIVQWSYVQAILAACWAHEDRDNVQQWLQCAQLLESLL